MKPKRSGPFDLRPIGVIRSTLKKRSEAPKPGSEGAPEAWIEVEHEWKISWLCHIHSASSVNVSMTNREEGM